MSTKQNNEAPFPIRTVFIITCRIVDYNPPLNIHLLAPVDMKKIWQLRALKPINVLKKMARKHL